MRQRSASFATAALIATLICAGSASILDEIPDFDEDAIDADDAGDGMASAGQQSEELLAPHMDTMWDSMHESDANHVEALFGLLDMNMDGIVDAEEISDGLRRQLKQHAEQLQALHDEETEHVLRTADSNSDGKLSLEEFKRANLVENVMPAEDVFAFGNAGTNDEDGFLTAVELKDALFPESSPRLPEYQQILARRIIEAHDQDADSKMNAAELARLALHMQELGQADEVRSYCRGEA